MGSVSRFYERIGETVQGNVQGSTAIAKTGYRFVKWVKGTNPNGDAVSTEVEYKPTTKGTYMAVFEAVKSDLVVRYVEDTDGKEISESETTSYEYGESYTVTAKDIKGYRLKSESPITGTKGVAREEVTFTYTQKKGKVVYNLGPNGSWGNGSPENVVEFDTAKGKWAYNYGFDKGDKFVVTKSVPTSSDNAVFVGWYDKKRDNTPATMRKAGDTVTYPYTEASDTNTYTLDALWEKLQGADKELPYDGKEHSLDEFTVKFTNDNLQGWTDSASSLVQASNIQYRLEQDGKNEWGAMPNFKDAGTYTIEAKATVNGVELTAEATLTISPRSVTLTSQGKSREYNGKALELPEVTVEGDGFVNGEVTDIKATGSITRVGKVTNKITYTPSDKFKEKNYTITKHEGELEVTNRKQKYEITVTAKSGEAKYTGESHTLEGLEATKEGLEATKFTVDGNEYTVSGLSAKVTGTDAGSYTNEVAGTAVVKDKAGKDVTAQFTVKTANGTLTISPRSVTLTSQGKSREYNGKALELPEVTVEGDGFVNGEVTDIKATGSITRVGKVTNKITYTPSDKFKEKNYTITKHEGELSITEKSIIPDGPKTPEEKKTGIKVTAPKDTTYSGNEQKREPVIKDTKTGKTLDKDDYSLSYSDDVTNAGTVTITVTGKGNYSGKFEVTYKILPRKVTLRSETASKPYDGTALTKPAVKVSGDGFVKGEVSDIKANGSVTTVSEGEVTNTITFTKENNYKAGNYTIVKDEGKLSITAQSINPGKDPEKPNPDYTGAKVNSPKDSVYDGKEHKWIPTVTDKADKKLEAGTDYTVEYSTMNFKDVGTVEVTITGKGNYTGTVKRSYKVTPKEYTVTTDSATKTYSGTALTAGGKVEGIVSGETVEFTTTGSQTEVGTSKNTYELVWKSAKATNYTLAKESIGKLTVKAKSIVPDDKDTPESDKTGITVSEPSDSKYDGNEHKEVLTVTDTKTGKELVAGTDYSVTYSSDLVNAGTVTIKVAGLGNYTGSFTKTYKITKRSVTLTSATVSKVYDGSALTNTSITVSGDGFVEGEGASYEVTGTQTKVGNSANAFEYKLNENTLASNYNITKVVGTLTITAAPAPVTPTTPSTPSSTTSTTPRTPSAPQVTTPVETVEKETTPKAEPKKEEKVEEEYTPKASPQYYWALINLICAILTVLFGLLLLISKRHKSEDHDEEDDDETKQQTNDDDEDKEQEKKRGLFTRVLAVLIAIVSVVFFLVTEDLSLPWTWTDQWTIWMVVIGLVQIVVFFVGRKWKNVDDDEDEEEAQQA